MTIYDELLGEARTRVETFQASTANEYVPKMYYALRDEELSPEDARDRITKDCVGLWSKRTLLNALPDEAKDQKKQKAGRLRQKEHNSAASNAAQSSKKKEVTIDTLGRTIETETPSTASVASMAVVSNRENRNDVSISDRNEIERGDHILHFELAIESSEISDHIFLSSDKYIWFNGTLDKITGKVTAASIGRMPQVSPNESSE